jgi:hypothetical protein
MLDGTDTSETTSYDSIASCWGIGGQTEDLRAIGSDLVEKFITMYSRLPAHTPFFPLSAIPSVSLSRFGCCLSFSPMQIKTRGLS